jgi:hypothetical protein
MKIRKQTLGLILILMGVGLPLVSIPLSSEYDGHDSFLLRLVRVILTGEIVLREGRVEVVEDRDEHLYAELMEYRGQLGRNSTLSEDRIIDRFYEEKYRGLMPRVEFNLKLEKKQVVPVQRKTAISNLSIFIGGLVLIIAGEVIRIVARRRNSL